MGALLYILLFAFIGYFSLNNEVASTSENIDISPTSTPQTTSTAQPPGTTSPTPTLSPSPSPIKVQQVVSLTPSPTASPKTEQQPPVVAGTSTNTTQEIFRLTNIERQKLGLPTLRQDSRLNDIAKRRATYLAESGQFGHYGSGGTEQGFSLIKQAGIPYTTAGENLGEGYSTAASLLAAWMTSSTHKANIINPDFTSIGIGQATVGSGTNAKTVVVQLFIGS